MRYPCELDDRLLHSQTLQLGSGQTRRSQSRPVPARSHLCLLLCLNATRLGIRYLWYTCQILEFIVCTEDTQLLTNGLQPHSTLCQPENVIHRPVYPCEQQTALVLCHGELLLEGESLISGTTYQASNFQVVLMAASHQLHASYPQLCSLRAVQNSSRESSPPICSIVCRKRDALCRQGGSRFSPETAHVQVFAQERVCWILQS